MASLQQLIQRYPSESFSKGQTLLLKDETPKAVYVIEKGLVKAYTITSDGAERQVKIHEAGEDIPLGFGLGLIDHAEYFYKAYSSSCVIRFVPRAAFSEHLRSDAEAMYQHHVKLASQLINTLEQISALEHPKASDKVAFMLLHMANQVGTKIRPYKTRLKLSVTQQEIADALGLTRETTGAELKKLELKNIISSSRKSYVLYMERLKRYLNGR